MSLTRKMEDKSIRMGVKVKDIVSGFTGIVTGKLDFLTGCTQWCVAPKSDSKSSDISGTFIDETRLEYVDKGISDKLDANGKLTKGQTTTTKTKTVGGPSTPAKSIRRA